MSASVAFFSAPRSRRSRYTTSTRFFTCSTAYSPERLPRLTQSLAARSEIVRARCASFARHSAQQNGCFFRTKSQALRYARCFSQAQARRRAPPRSLFPKYLLLAMRTVCSGLRRAGVRAGTAFGTHGSRMLRLRARCFAERRAHDAAATVTPALLRRPRVASPPPSPSPPWEFFFLRWPSAISTAARPYRRIAYQKARAATQKLRCSEKRFIDRWCAQRERTGRRTAQRTSPNARRCYSSRETSFTKPAANQAPHAITANA